MNTNISLKEELTQRFPRLFDKFKIVEDHFDPQSFGNSFATLESPELRLRLVRDRGQFSAEIGPLVDHGTWWNIEHVAELLGFKPKEPVVDLESFTRLVQDYYPALVDLLGPKLSQTRIELRRRSEQRREAFLRRARGGD